MAANHPSPLTNSINSIICVGNISGAFADGAILFPLMAALAVSTGMNGAFLLGGAGAAYIFAGFFFRIPMPVQPLKSIVVGAVALGASAGEVRLATLGIGLFCLSVMLLPVERIEKCIPRHLIHGIQFSLGVLLVTNGIEWVWGEGSVIYFTALALLMPAAIFMQSRIGAPVLGVIAVLGIACGFWPGEHAAVIHTKAAVPKTGIQPGIVISLLLPQLALTLTNSVVGTYDTARRYFGEVSSRVTLKNLLLSIGIGNVIAAAIGGLPFCHGSGGMTAHVRAGAKDYTMNFYIGGFLVLLVLASVVLKVDLMPHYPVLLMAALVCMTGWYHMQLAADSWKTTDLRIIILAMGLTVLITHNMLYGLLMGITFEAARRQGWLKIKT